jgi:hypothetical protein
MRWAGYVALWGTGDVHTGFWRGDLTKRDHLEDLIIGWRIILKWVFKKWNGETWIGLIWLRIGRGGGLL